ncbi:MAG: hypothetical protein GY885_05160, partial [Phycisphaeraceae bacterium]|nr:hypothetical protein [Phycisphaeraceae bacterium]
NGGAVSWYTSEYAQDPLANSIRWGTQYNFWFVTDSAPEAGLGDIEIYRTDDVATANIFVPAGGGGDNPYDLNGDGIVNGADIGLFLALWGDVDGPGDFNADGIVNGADFGMLLAAFG